MESPSAIYLHIPFCHALCHYCDFAKTANYLADHVRGYFGRLEEQLRQVVPNLSAPIQSVFFGGGTPGLFTDEYRPLLNLLRPLLTPNAELSLEANPNNCTEEHLKRWREMGFNRLSIGIQTFEEVGLKFLTRDHSAAEAERSIRAGLDHFPNLNIDLIYGWQGQSPVSWESDLRRALDLGVPHLSLYCLTYESKTPIGRALIRGRLTSADDQMLEGNYETARRILQEAGFDHEEVSNWCRPGFSCRHNWVYWTGGRFLGLGAGAHGFLDDGTELGFRYAFNKDFRAFMRVPAIEADNERNSGADAIGALIAKMGGSREADRDRESALTEYVGSALRTAKGVSLQRMAAISLRTFKPRPTLLRGISENMVILDQDSLRLHPAEWFRENAWAVEVILSFV